MAAIPKTKHAGSRDLIMSRTMATVSFVFVFVGLFFITGMARFGGEVTDPETMFGQWACFASVGR